MTDKIKKEGDFQFIETAGSGETIVLLHGLFGALSNFEGILGHFGEKNRVIVPILPIYTLPLRKVSIGGLLAHVERFIEEKGLTDIHLVGNSLGGHISLLYTLKNQHLLKSLVLTGSSGLFENAMGSTFPQRGNYEFIRKKTADTFYDPKIATKELVDEVFDTVNDRNKAIRVVATAKSAIRHNVANRLHEITIPTLLIWGREDTITPHYVGEQFHQRLPNSTLVFFEKCGHAPMMEHPEKFNRELDHFLSENFAPAAQA